MSAKLLDWIGAMDFAHYKTKESPDYKPSGPTHFYLKGSPERFTSKELIKIFTNKMGKTLNERWQYALANHVKWQKRQKYMGVVDNNWALIDDMAWKKDKNK